MTICVANLIPIVITLLVCGFLFVFFNARLAEVKNAVEKQNRVLTAFITNVQNDIRGGGGIRVGNPAAGGDVEKCAIQRPIGVNHLVSEEALNAVLRDNEKIVVSEDETDNDSDSDSESSDDSSDDENDNDDEQKDEGDSIKIIKLQDSSSAETEPPVLNVESLLSVTDVTDVTDVTEDTLKVVNLDQVVDVAHEVVDYEHTKVDDLRKIVSDKNLATKDEVKKLKKPELLALLKN
jgi:hypothetical protein